MHVDPEVCVYLHVVCGEVYNSFATLRDMLFFLIIRQRGGGGGGAKPPNIAQDQCCCCYLNVHGNAIYHRSPRGLSC